MTLDELLMRPHPLTSDEDSVYDASGYDLFNDIAFHEMVAHAVNRIHELKTENIILKAEMISADGWRNTANHNLECMHEYRRLSDSLKARVSELEERLNSPSTCWIYSADSVHEQRRFEAACAAMRMMPQLARDISKEHPHLPFREIMENLGAEAWRWADTMLDAEQHVEPHPSQSPNPPADLDSLSPNSFSRKPESEPKKEWRIDEELYPHDPDFVWITCGDEWVRCESTSRAQRIVRLLNGGE